MKPESNNISFDYRLDSSDCITFVNSEWLSFAEQNKAPEISQSIIGKSVWCYLAGKEVRHLYELIFDAVRNRNKEIVIPFRCDSPTSRRYMELKVSPRVDKNLSLAAHILQEEARPYVALLDSGEHSDKRNTENYLKICSWCKRLNLKTERWVEVEQAIRELELFEEASLPGLTHGICPDCVASIRCEIEQASEA